MSESALWILLLACVADWFAGDSERIWKRIPHPVVWIGKLVQWCDERFNREGDSEEIQIRNGILSWSLAVGVSLAAGILLHWLFVRAGWIGFAAETFVVFAMLAQKSLRLHVEAVASALREETLGKARKAVSKIVGRNPDLLDRSGIAKAALESLAENFSDGIAAPAMAYALFGLPGILAYKAINTADSMIAHRNQRYRFFGKASALADDVANWIPARFSAFLIAAGAFVSLGPKAASRAMDSAMRDASLHDSKNAGWPEAALAGALGIALGGPRKYSNHSVEQSHLNAAGRLDLGAKDVKAGVSLYARSCFAMWSAILILAAFASLAG